MTPAEYRKLKKPAKKNKYGARKTVVDGIKFDSAGQAKRWAELKLLERAGVISGLQCEPTYKLLGFNGTLICKMKPDFRYHENGKTIIEDFKSPSTAKRRDFLIKKKLFEDNFPGIEFRISER